MTKQNFYYALHSLVSNIIHTGAIKNSFYTYWIENKFNHKQLCLFATNFYAHVAPTSDRIIALLTKTQDNETRKNLLENIADEVGIGGKPHTELLKTFFNALLTKSGQKGKTVEQLPNTLILNETTELINRGMMLFSHEEEEVRLGALLAQEWHAYPQLVRLYEGARNYMNLFELDEFHENCEYFYIHIGATEKNHKDQSLMVNSKIIKFSDQFDRVKHGFDEYVKLLVNYWQALYQGVKALASENALNDSELVAIA